MNVAVQAPDLGDGVTHAMIGAWHAGPGDRVRKDEPIVDVVTDKAAYEVLSPADGLLFEVCFSADEEFEAGAVLGRIKPE
jgi:pyruvate/2-oxoglutarate dehydrogenase complex dihydrolipoamide acyltransferase (E2) component